MNEMQTRLGYILPLFKALGWDTSNINEVSPEEKVSRGWVDFSFRIGNVPRYFLETKKVNEDLNDPRWVKQAIDYAWTKSVTWALLSDFEGLRVFNAEWKESNPFSAQFIAFDLDSYLTEFERLWWLSRPETLARRLDAEAEKVGKKVKRLPVSQHLFDDLKKWRENLFKNYKAFNLGYSAAQIDEAVLRLLNRLIFIRTAEDREVEDNRLRSLVRVLKDKKQISRLDRELAELFRQLDATYNSELFAPHFSEELQIPPSDLEEVIEGLYEKNYVLYNFNALDADVLGTAYEQYLGHVVAEGDASSPLSAHVEEKRTKRKSQGIYYTPAFVTKYIVRQTLGRYLDEHGYNPSRPPRVLDMACGSGSFLIEAFDVIDAYVAKQRGQSHKGEVDILDRARQLEVLQNCIFGVDKDRQAVEVARLNLLLRALHSREKLPMLDNVQHGNSLISGTPEELKIYFGENWRAKDPFNWEQEFEQVMRDGGFDLVIGNPPYVNAYNMQTDDRLFFSDSGKYASPHKKYDLYVLFLENALRLLKEGGRLGFIIPHPILNQTYAERIRKIILDTCSIETIVDLSNFRVFQEATVSTCILIVRKENDELRRQKNQLNVIRQLDYSTGILASDSSYQIPQSVFYDTSQYMFRLELETSALRLAQRIEAQSFKTEDLFYVSMGAEVHSREDSEDKRGKEALILTQPKGDSKPYLEGKEVGRYTITWQHRYLDYVPSKMRRPKFHQLFENPKILVRAIAYGLSATYDTNGFYVDQKLICCMQYRLLDQRRQVRAPTTYWGGNKYHDLYVLGLMNSRVLAYYYQAVLFDGLSIVPDNIRKLPIRRIDFENPAEASAHDEIVKLVEKMLALQKERRSVRLEDDLDRVRALEKEIARVDAEIDRQVYALYGLTEEEIKIVEGR
jgi:type I restriction-modification system DNA methylase subunit